MTEDWRQYDQASLDAQYDNHAAAGAAGAAALARLRALAIENRRHLAVLPDILYGPAPDMRLDLYPPAQSPAQSPAPCLVLVHGGGWLGGDAAGSGFWAAALAERGIAHVVVTHAKRPQASLGDMADQVTTAWRFVRAQAPAWGLDPDRLHLAGISSGATLAALAAIEEAPASLLLLGGMYDLAPVRASARNKLLDLSEADVEVLSPIRRGRPPCPILVGHGEHETAEFRRQSRSFAENIGAELLAIAGASHFSQSEALLDAASPLSQAFARHLTLETAS